MTAPNDTIVAQATALGRGGVGVVRVSGSHTTSIARALLGTLPPPRQATYTSFVDANQQVIDLGIALYFPRPHSFTGEDVLELHGHGSPIVMQTLIQRAVALGARLAKPGEFSERAFLNHKIDLAQAEAIADLIDSASQQAAQCAIRSLQGEFSLRIQQLVDELTRLRMFIEAAIDFPDEEVDFLTDSHVAATLQTLIEQVERIQTQATQGSVLREGLHLVLAGQPNVGKSTLLNQLAGYDAAIVTDIPGTTRDVMREQLVIDGIPIHLFDTAGLRDSTDAVEQEGIKRAQNAIKNADAILLVMDSTQWFANPTREQLTQGLSFLPDTQQVTLILNKIDLTSEPCGSSTVFGHPCVALSAKTGAGIDALRQKIRQWAGMNPSVETLFMARKRHLVALQQAHTHLQQAQQQLAQGELLAEDCRLAQQALAEITGAFTSDDLLGKIFSNFCIGK